jgi:hypothetical protein
MEARMASLDDASRLFHLIKYSSPGTVQYSTVTGFGCSIQTVFHIVQTARLITRYIDAVTDALSSLLDSQRILKFKISWTAASGIERLVTACGGEADAQIDG